MIVMGEMAGDDSKSPRVVRGGGQTGDREMKLRPTGQTLTGKSILHHPFHPAPLPSSVSLSLSLLATVSLSPSQEGFIYNLFSNVLFFFLCICSVALNDDTPAKSK